MSNQTYAHSKQEASKRLAAKFSTKYICKNCGNREQNRFEENTSQGQVTCRVCAVVAQDHKIHEGEWKRQFEGDVNPSFHGPGMCCYDAQLRLIYLGLPYMTNRTLLTNIFLWSVLLL